MAALGGKLPLTCVQSAETYRLMKLAPRFSYIALLALELAYTFFVFDPASAKVQAGLMLIFAVEIAFAIRVAKVQLYLKQIDQPLVIKSRTYAAVYAIGMAVAMFIGLGMFPFTGVRWVMGGAFVAIASAKVGWEHYFGSYVGSIPASDH